LTIILNVIVKNSPPNLQAHCQVAPANPHAKAWQRACLPQRTDRMTIQQKLKKNNKKNEQRNANKCYM